MKKLSLLLASLLFTAIAASAYPLYEPFNYDPSVNTNLIGQTNPDGQTWVQAGPALALTNQPFISLGSLSYPGLAPSIGNSASANGLTGTTASPGLAARFPVPTVTSGTLYFSFLCKLTDLTGLSTSGVFWAAFNNSSGSQLTVPTVVTTRVVTKTNAAVAGGFFIGLDKSSATPSGFVFATNQCVLNQTIFIVGSYTFNSSGTADDVSQLWVDPDASTFGAATAPTNAIVNSNGGDIAQIASFCLFLDRNNGQPRGITMDELIISTNWADVTPTRPVITGQPQSQRVLAGSTATFTASAYKVMGYQWQLDGTNLPGANTTTLTIPNSQAGNVGSYTLIATNGATAVTSSVATLSVVPDVYPRLRSLWNIPPNTTNYPYVTTDTSNTPNLRSIAYSSFANQVLVASRTNYLTGSTNPAIYVLDAPTGTNMWNLDTTVINGGALWLTCIGVADDGAVYAVNETAGGTGGNFRIYRWPDSTSGQVGTMVYNGTPDGTDNTPRWGDAMAVRGAGVNTVIIADSNDGNWFASFTPVDSSMASFQCTVQANSYGGGSIGRSLQFGNTNSYYAKRHSEELQLATYDTTPFDPVIVQTNFSNFPSTVGQVGFPLSSNLLCAIDYGSSTPPDTLDLFEVSDMSLPLLLGKYNFPTNHQGNANFIGQVLFVGKNVYALDANNGIMALTVAPQPPTLSIAISGSNVIVSWPTNATGYTLYSSPTVSPTSWTSAGTGTIVGSNYQVSSAISAAPKFYRLQQ